MKNRPNFYIAIFCLIISVTIFVCSLYNYSLSSVSNSNKLKEIEIEKGSINSIAKKLKENNLIKSTFSFKVYIYISGNTSLKAATYQLSENMGTKKIVEILSSNSGSNSNDIKLTFNEGLNMRDVATIIESNTNNSKEDVYRLIEDKNYLKELINEYWFLTDDILNDKIYYALEGYLYPNTYSFTDNNVSVKEIFKAMLDEMDKKLSDYKDKINDNDLSLHELITLASMVELEGVNLEDRKGIASVFYNRLSDGMTLGSDVTTYYGAKIDMSERALYSSEISDCNDYNTRCSSFRTLPVSPICNPSIEAIEAAIEPEDTDYYYFVADVNKKIYFSKSREEHNQIIYKLKSDDLWFEY